MLSPDKRSRSGISASNRSTSANVFIGLLSQLIFLVRKINSFGITHVKASILRAAFWARETGHTAFFLLQDSVSIQRQKKRLLKSRGRTEIFEFSNGMVSDPKIAIRSQLFWVSPSLQYAGYVKGDRGALYALNQRSGDCTEFTESSRFRKALENFLVTRTADPIPTDG